jgi:EmrB/QacA subfamily drug resistance transporter
MIPKGANQQDRRYRLALLVVCFGTLMVAVDTSIVNVALPMIRAELGSSEQNLLWTVQAYFIAFGGFLLLGGRLGDMFGHRRIFMIGIAVFTLASLACGFAGSQRMLIGARAVQGIGGAIICVLTTSLIIGYRADAATRARALGVNTFVNIGGGTLGLVLGGVLSTAFGWRWIFLVNVPIGIAIFVLGHRLLPHFSRRHAQHRLDIMGSLAVTSSVILAIVTITNADQVGWATGRTLAGAAVTSALLLLFWRIEARTPEPIMPLNLLQIPGLIRGSAAIVLSAVGTFGWFYIYARYLQLVLSYAPLDISFAYLPAELVTAVVSVGVSPFLVARIGIKWPLIGGLVGSAVGLGLLAKAPLLANQTTDVLPGMLLLGVGIGMAHTPLTLAALNEVSRSVAGVASGVVSTIYLLGGTLGLAILESIAAGHEHSLLRSGLTPAVAQQMGFRVALLCGSLAIAAAALIGLSLRLRRDPLVQPQGPPADMSGFEMDRATCSDGGQT